jgi:hypothetical protein
MAERKREREKQKEGPLPSFLLSSLPFPDWFWSLGKRASCCEAMRFSSFPLGSERTNAVELKIDHFPYFCREPLQHF